MEGSVSVGLHLPSGGAFGLIRSPKTSETVEGNMHIKKTRKINGSCFGFFIASSAQLDKLIKKTNKSSITGTIRTNQQRFNTTFFGILLLRISVVLSLDGVVYCYSAISLTADHRVFDIINKNINQSCLLPSANLHIFTWSNWAWSQLPA